MAKDQIDRTTYSVSDLLSWQRAGGLDLNPDFQRRPVWKPGAKSYLLDTIIRNLPTPVVFLRELPADLDTLESRREVVDGQQRLRTLFSYIAPDSLEDYNEATDFFTIQRAHNPDLAGKTFNQLPKETRRAILDYRFGVHVFDADVGDREILQIFARMNATGVRLNDQELRNAEYYGEFKTTAFELAAEQLERWRNWKLFSAYNIARMEEVELTSELMIVILNGVSEKSATAIDRYYTEYDELFSERDEVARRFRHVFDAIDAKFSESTRLFYSKRTLFYCLFCSVYDHAFGIGSKLAPKKAKPLTKALLSTYHDAGVNISSDVAPDEVLDATTRRTTHVKERKTIIGYLANPVTP